MRLDDVIRAALADEDDPRPQLLADMKHDPAAPRAYQPRPDDRNTAKAPAASANDHRLLTPAG